MKKLLVVLLALLTVGALFAEGAGITVGGWGRIDVVPVANTTVVTTGTSSVAGVTIPTTTTTNWYAGSGPSWASGARVGVNFAGNSDNVGFNLNVDSNNGSLAVGDQAKIWVKINDMVTVQAGKIQGDTLRGKIDSDSSSILDTFGAGYAYGKDNVFQRFYPNKGLLIDVKPVAGLYIGYAYDTTGLANAGLTGDQLEQSLWNSQAGVGYTIENIGLARVQYIGNGRKIQAAFAYTGLAGLTVDAGFTYLLEPLSSTTVTVPTAGSFVYTVLAQNTVDVAASYSKDALSIQGRVDVALPTASAYATDFGGGVSLSVADAQALGLGVWLDASYALATPFTVGVEGEFASSGSTDTATVTGVTGSYVTGSTKLVFAAVPYAKLGYSNGYLKAGFALASTTGATATAYSFGTTTVSSEARAKPALR